MLGLEDAEPIKDDADHDALTEVLRTTPPTAVDIATLQQEYMIRGR